MNINLSEKEINLIKEALTNNSVQYDYEASVIKDEDPEWSEKMFEKSDDMMQLLNKLS